MSGPRHSLAATRQQIQRYDLKILEQQASVCQGKEVKEWGGVIRPPDEFEPNDFTNLTGGEILSKLLQEAEASGRLNEYQAAMAGAGVMIIFLVLENIRKITTLSRRYVSLVERLLQLKRAFRIDRLTKLQNFDGILRELQHAINLLIRQPPRNPASICVIFGDMDGFKPFNDLYGHAIGDEVLVRTGITFRDNLRGYDSLGRPHGDEFIAVVSDTTIQHVQSLMERVATAIRSEICAFSSARNLDTGFSTGISLGACQCTIDPASKEVTFRFMALNAGTCLVVDPFRYLEAGEEERTALRSLVSQSLIKEAPNTAQAVETLSNNMLVLAEIAMYICKRLNGHEYEKGISVAEAAAKLLGLRKVA